MANLTSANVTVGKPKVSGQIFCGGSTAVAPTDATTDLGTGYTSLGYISEDGVSNNYSVDSEDIKDWSGDIVNTVITGKTDEWKYKLIEAINEDVIKYVYGESSYSSNKLSVSGLNSKANKIVIEMIMSNGKAKRIYIPLAKISELGEISYKNNEPVGYEITIKGMSDGTSTHYELTES